MLPRSLLQCEHVRISDTDDGRTAVERPDGEVTALSAREWNHALRREVEADTIPAKNGLETFEL